MSAGVVSQRRRVQAECDRARIRLYWAVPAGGIPTRGGRTKTRTRGSSFLVGSSYTKHARIRRVVCLQWSYFERPRTRKRVIPKREWVNDVRGRGRRGRYGLPSHAYSRLARGCRLYLCLPGKAKRPRRRPRGEGSGSSPDS